MNENERESPDDIEEIKAQISALHKRLNIKEEESGELWQHAQELVDDPFDPIKSHTLE